MMKSSKVIITCAVTGSIHTPSMSAYLPITPDQIVAEAVAAAEAGAAMIHLHVRDTSHAPTLDQALLREWVAAVRESSALVVQLSTGGSVHDPLDERLAHLLRLLQGPPSDPEDRCERLLRALRKPSDHDDVALLIAQAHPLKT